MVSASTFRACLLVFGTLAVVPAEAREPITGTPQVVDGDTLKFGKRTVRLSGIDAPEKNQICRDQGGLSYNCGEAATRHLADLIGGGTVTCHGEATDRYRRVVATCRAGAVDLGAAMVRQGYAVAYTKYSDAYLVVEIEARIADRGLWRGEFVRPEEHRRMVRAEREAQRAAREPRW